MSDGLVHGNRRLVAVVLAFALIAAACGGGSDDGDSDAADSGSDAAVDTGASGVSIPANYARRLGIQVDRDTPRVQVRTANGVIAVPLVRLDSVKVGGAQVDGLMATVNPTMETGLLGGSFFNHFNYQVDPAARVISLERNHAVVSGLGEDHWRRRFREIRGPLTELEHYLDTEEISRPARRRELERKRDELRARLATLVVAANRDDIPHAWRR